MPHCKFCKTKHKFKTFCGPDCKDAYQELRNVVLNRGSGKRRDILEPTPEPPKYLQQSITIFERDAWLCYYCGIHLHSLPSTNYNIDHVYPKSLGGPDTASNLVTSCRSCNQAKGAKVDIDKITQTLKDVNARNEAFGVPSDLVVRRGT